MDKFVIQFKNSSGYWETLLQRDHTPFTFESKSEAIRQTENLGFGKIQAVPLDKNINHGAHRIKVLGF